MRRNIVSSNGIETAGSDNRVAISRGGIEIRRGKRPISGELTKVGFVYLVVDCSLSMEGQKLWQAKEGALNFAKDALTKEYSTGLVQFESTARHLCEPQRDIEVLYLHLEKMQVGGTTNMTDAIQLTTERLKNKAGFRVMVVITDGMPNNKRAALRAAERAKNNGIDIITIGTDDADERFLKRLASRDDLNVMVSSGQLGQGIASTTKMLPLYGK